MADVSIGTGSRRKVWFKGFQYLMVLLVAFYLAAPFYWMIVSSLMRESEAMAVPPHWFPRRPTLENYMGFFSGGSDIVTQVGAQVARDVPAGILNSLLVGFAVVAANLVLGSPAAYSLARLDFRWNHRILLFYLASRSVPGIAILVPLYLIFRSYQLLNTLSAVVLAHTTFTLPFTIWILHSYFRTIPLDLEEAARTDGCTRLGAMVRIFIPLSTPGVVAAAIFSFMLSWSEFFASLILTSSQSARTLPVVVSGFVSQSIRVEFTVIATGGVLAALPPIVLALLFQRFLVRGLVGGAVRG